MAVKGPPSLSPYPVEGPFDQPSTPFPGGGPAPGLRPKPPYKKTGWKGPKKDTRSFEQKMSDRMKTRKRVAKNKRQAVGASVNPPKFGGGR